MRVLAGDVGGTNCRLAVCEVEGGQRVRKLAEHVYPSAEYPAFTDVVRIFIDAHGSGIETAAFGLPGPVRGRKAQLTNLPWVIDADTVEQDLGLARVTLINDLVANAHGLVSLRDDELRVVRAGNRDPEGNQGLISPGTGLGQAGIARIGKQSFPFATEGGHTDFGPSNPLEEELLTHLRDRFGDHVSWERVVSGPGVANLYDFFRARNPSAEPSWLADALREGDRSQVITANADNNELCREAVDLFFALFGAEAGNLGLKIMASGGIFLGGGIAPKMADQLVASQFTARFDGKGRLRHLVEQMPVTIVLNDKTALQGAAIVAATDGPR